MQEMSSGGSPLAGCNVLRKEGMSSRTSRALVSRLSIYKVDLQGSQELDPAATSLGMPRINPDALTSDRRGGRSYVREKGLTYPAIFQEELLVQHMRGSGMERPRANSKDMVVDDMIDTGERLLAEVVLAGGAEVGLTGLFPTAQD